MNVAIGSDHAGFQLKSALIEYIKEMGHAVRDVGTYSTEPADYPDSALSVAKAVIDHPGDRGILICGSGVGACVAANKVPGVRAALCHDTFSAHQGVEDDDMNVLCLGARVVGPELAKEVVRTFLGATFSRADRHLRRLAKVQGIEQSFSKDRS